ncbi:hypothetical protein GF377_00150, partial [candidate division GN15 bacterium]|nr:hypothetical protein [candidate division GN15 bacterium]
MVVGDAAPKPRLWLRIVVPILVLLLFFAIVESIVRIVDADTHFQNRFFVLNRALDYPSIIKKDHDLFWRLRPNREEASRFYEGKTYRINNLGLRGDNIGGKTKPRIVALGNSCTFGWGVDDNQAFPAVLEEKLDRSYEVINAGVPGYSSYQGRVFFEQELVDLDPDVVLIMFSWNDIWAAAGEIADKDQEFPPPIVIAIQNQLSRLHTYRLLKKLLLTPVEPPTDSLFSHEAPVYRVSRDDFAANLTAICSTARANDCTPVLMTAPIASTQLY